MTHCMTAPAQVFDGHSGEAAARFAEQHLLPNLLREESFLTAPAEALVRAHALPAMRALTTQLFAAFGAR